MKRKLFKISAPLILLVPAASFGMALFFWLRPEGTFTPALSSAPSYAGLEVRVLSWNILQSAGFANAESSCALTYHIRGKGIRCLDHILTDTRWHVAHGGILKEMGGSVFPSDHFGLWAKLALR